MCKYSKFILTATYLCVMISMCILLNQNKTADKCFRFIYCPHSSHFFFGLLVCLSYWRKNSFYVLTYVCRYSLLALKQNILNENNSRRHVEGRND